MEQLNIVFKSNDVQPLLVEVFNSLNSFASVWKPEYNTPGSTVNYKPALRWEAPSGAVQTHLSALSFTPAGELILSRGNGALIGSIECLEYPYLSLLKALETRKIKINKIRMRSLTQAQLIEPVTLIKYTALTAKLDQKIYKITISPLNVQPLLNDWTPKPELIIDGETGLTFNVLPNEVLQWTIDFNFL